jgi:hypothetical protein
MKRGKRNHFVQFQSCTNGVWSNYFQQWISLEPAGSSSDPLMNMFHCETHYNASIVPRTRFVEGTNIYQVMTVVNVDSNSREMILEATQYLESTP